MNDKAGTTTVEVSKKSSDKALAKANKDRQIEFFAQDEAKTEGIEVGGGFSCSDISLRRLLVMAAVSPKGSTDPVDVALKESLRYRFRHGAPNVEIPVENFDPPVDRRYSLARINDMKRTKSGESRNTIIARGDLESVMNVAETERSLRTLLRKNAQMAGSRGYRCLGVATATVDENGEISPFTMEGFVNVRPVGTGLRGGDLTPTSEDWVRLSVWSASLRFLHWLNVFLIVTLSVTGYYILDPFFGDTFFRGIDPGFLMGIMRFIHFAAAFAWLAVGAARIIIAFISKDRYMRWETFWPFKKKQDWINFKETVGFYLFLRKESPLYVAHNPLQQMAYTSIYVLGAFQMLIGVALYALPYKNTNLFWQILAMPNDWLGIPMMRFIHAMIMFMFWGFVIGHIYLAFRADSLERHGGISSMISGGVWMRRTSKPYDAPEL